MEYTIKKGIINYFKIYDDIAAIDAAVFSDDMCGTFKNELSRYLKYPREFVILYADGKAVAYIQYFPVTDSYAAKIYADNRIHDDDITAKDLNRLKKYNFSHIYLLSAAMLPDYWGGEAMKILGKAFSEELIRLHSAGYYIRDIISTAISDKGRSTLSAFGLKDIKTLEGGYSLYAGSMADFISAYEIKK